MSIGKDAYKDYEPAGKEEGFFPLVENCRVLEIGFGSGKLLEGLAQRGNDVYGIDASESLVAAAEQRGFKNVYHADMSEDLLPWPDDYFDAVYAYEVFEHLTNPHRLFYEVRRTLKRDHPFFFSVPCQESDMGYGPGLHPFVYPGLMLREHLERFIMQMYFRIDDYIETGVTLEGRSYKLCNKKSPEKPDIVYVVPTQNNVRTLYGEVVDEETLRSLIEHEVTHLLYLTRFHAQNKDLDQVRGFLKHLTTEYPEYYPMYVELARILASLDQVKIARGLLDILFRREDEVGSDVIEAARAMKAEIEAGTGAPRADT